MADSSPRPARLISSPRRFLRVAPLGLALLIGLAAWQALRPAAPAAPPAAEDAAPAPDFTARLLEGGTFTLSEQRGKPVLILFTASWCSSCIPEVNKMAQLQEEFGPRGLRQLVLSVDPGDTEADFAGLRQRTRGANLLWALDPGQKATLAYQVKATDTKVLIDPEGREVFRAVGPTPLELLRQHIAALLPEVAG